MSFLARSVQVYEFMQFSILFNSSVQEKSLLVMENLFYECKIANKFDLKGSDRNRLVDPTNQNGEIVLLDENLIQSNFSLFIHSHPFGLNLSFFFTVSWSKPLYILSHSNTILREAILRDASFLEKSDVMDYSLLVGLNSDDKLLVLGIIGKRKIRTFIRLIVHVVGML